MKLNDLSWELFKQTGNIDAYMLYKTTAQTTKESEKWESSQQKGLSSEAPTSEKPTVY